MERCERCGRELDPKFIVWLELNAVTGKYCAMGDVPEKDSQGCFPFGAACAKKELEKQE